MGQPHGHHARLEAARAAHLALSHALAHGRSRLELRTRRARRARSNPRRSLFARALRARDPNYTGKVTVPVLWDKRQDTLVSNESADMLRMLNSAFDAFSANQTDY